MVNKMVDNKQRLYWMLQIGGWTLYAVVQIVASVLASASSTISTQRIIFLTYEAFFCLLISHIYRSYINRWRWLSLGMPRLIPRVLLTSFFLGVVIYFLRIPASVSLGLFNRNIVFDSMNVAGQSLYYAILFFLWSVFYFI